MPGVGLAVAAVPGDEFEEPIVVPDVVPVDPVDPEVVPDVVSVVGGVVVPDVDPEFVENAPLRSVGGAAGPVVFVF